MTFFSHLMHIGGTSFNDRDVKFVGGKLTSVIEEVAPVGAHLRLKSDSILFFSCWP